MNDRFKFRWYSYIYKEMCEVNCIEPINEFVNFNQGKYNNISTAINSKNGILMQCTGMKDKNGKLIYEGDFLKDDENLLYEVTFKLQEYATSFSLKRREIPDYYPHITTWCGLGYRNCNKYEVIGNIYENKELLECQK